MIKFILFTFFTCSFLIKDVMAFSRNMGHRVGAGRNEYHRDLPENSLSALKAALLGRSDGRTPLQFHSKFYYLEFDVQETLDGELVLFHDKHIHRMLPRVGRNVVVARNLIKEISKDGKEVSYKSIKVKDLTLRQIKRLSLKRSTLESIPTLEEFLAACLEYGLQKPLTLEIKYIHSQKAKEKLISLLSNFRENFLRRNNPIFEEGYDLGKSGVNFLAFRSKFSKTFGKRGTESRKKWCQILKAHGFGKVYQAIFHKFDLCSL